VSDTKELQKTVKKTQNHNRDLNSTPPNKTQKYTIPGQPLIKNSYHPAISSAIRVTQGHESVPPGWHS